MYYKASSIRNSFFYGNGHQDYTSDALNDGWEYLGEKNVHITSTSAYTEIDIPIYKIVSQNTEHSIALFVEQRSGLFPKFVCDFRYYRPGTYRSVITGTIITSNSDIQIRQGKTNYLGNKFSSFSLSKKSSP